MTDTYGIKTFEEMIDILWKNRKQTFDKEYIFDFPEYGGLPKKIANKLASDVVDIIQVFYSADMIKDFKTKTQFRNVLKEQLFLMSHKGR